MRYRFTIDIDTDGNRMAVNRLAMEMKDMAVTSWSNPVFVSTEQVMATEEVQVLRQNRG